LPLLLAPVPAQDKLNPKPASPGTGPCGPAALPVGVPLDDPAVRDLPAFPVLPDPLTPRGGWAGWRQLPATRTQCNL